MATPIRIDIEADGDGTELWLLLSRHLNVTGDAAPPEAIALHVREAMYGWTSMANSSISTEAAEGVSLPSVSQFAC